MPRSARGRPERPVPSTLDPGVAIGPRLKSCSTPRRSIKNTGSSDFGECSVHDILRNRLKHTLPLEEDQTSMIPSRMSHQLQCTASPSSSLNCTPIGSSAPSARSGIRKELLGNMKVVSPNDRFLPWNLSDRESKARSEPSHAHVSLHLPLRSADENKSFPILPISPINEHSLVSSFSEEEATSPCPPQFSERLYQVPHSSSPSSPRACRSSDSAAYLSQVFGPEVTLLQIKAERSRASNWRPVTRILQESPMTR